MNIVWFSWKDRSHPRAGGAETVSGEIMDRLARAGHKVTLITALYSGAKTNETIDGINIIRAGGKYSVYFKACTIYKNNFSETIDLVIDEMNTIPFMASLYTHSSQTVLLTYQLARNVWFYQMAPPMSLVGYCLEPLMLRLISNAYTVTMTESSSTKNDLKKYGFKNVKVFRVGMALKPLKLLSPKSSDDIILSLGSIRPMKRTLHAVKAFEIARDNNNNLKMIIAGDNNGPYAKKVIRYISMSRHSNSIEVLGKVSPKQKLQLMRQSKLIVVTSIKEGWGLIITEANSQGTPAVAYDVDGLRDSIKNNITGILVPNSDFKAMGNEIIKLLSNKTKYESLRNEAWNFSKGFTFNNSYQDFLKHIF